jgi:hypothetical protein
VRVTFVVTAEIWGKLASVAKTEGLENEETPVKQNPIPATNKNSGEKANAVRR